MRNFSIGGTTMLRRTIAISLLASALLVLLASSGATGDPPPSFPAPQNGPTVVRRINAPYFPGDIRFSETAVAWFGQVTSTANAGDVRVGYNGDRLYVRTGAFDRWLWYDTTPSPADLTEWDAFTLYLDLDGNSATTLSASAYRFDAQLVWWEERDNYQAAYQGDGGSWVAASIPFTTTSFWRGYDSPNNNSENDRGWALTFSIPFTSLGLSGAPAQDSVWGMAVVLHDRDDAAGTPIPDQVWPETIVSTQPATWGQLHFGMPSHEPLPAIAGGTVTVRHGVNGATVTDADVGGSTNCGGNAWPDYFPTWGSLNYDGQSVLNVQNLGDIGDWPCFSRIYLTFPLDALPANKVVLSATLTMYQFGNAGAGEDPQSSLIQVLTVDEDWDEATINWNNSPLAVENVSAAWAGVFPALPGEPRHWDVSRAVAQAYAAGTPLRLALYESDWAYHSGKYFRSSEMDEYEAYMRPTLTIAWGDPVAEVSKIAQPSSGEQADPITYTLRFLGTGSTLFLTDTLPSGVSAPTLVSYNGPSGDPAYDAGHHRLTWSGVPALGQEVTIRYTASIRVGTPQELVNVAQLTEAGAGTSTDQAVVIANPQRVHLPLITRQH
jgi:hypothetical protein